MEPHFHSRLGQIKKAEHQRTDAFKLWCWRRLLRVPWNKPVNPKGNQTWIFIGKTDAKAETPIFGHLRWRDPDAGKDWRWEEKGMTEDEMVGWHHQLLEFTQTCPLSRWWHPTISSCRPLLCSSSVFPSIRVFSNELALCIRLPKYWSFSFSINPSNGYSGLISFGIDWVWSCCPRDSQESSPAP